MRAPLIVLLLAAAGGAGYFFYAQSREPAPPAPAAAPTRVEVSASDGAAPTIFANLCEAGRESFTRTEALALASGWARVADDVHPYVARIMEISRGADMPMASNVTLQAYAHPTHPQYLILTDMMIAGVQPTPAPVSGCYVYDFGATELADVSAFEARFGEPAEQMRGGPNMQLRKWVRPAGLPGVATLRVAYFGPGSQGETLLGFSGLLFALTSSSVL